MGNWVVTPDDLKKGDLVDKPGWYPAEIVRYEEGEAGKEAKNPGSLTATFIFKILDGPNQGIEVKRLFSETAWGFAKNFFAAMGYPKDEAGAYQISSSLFNRSVGHKLKIYIKRGKSDRGNEFNDVQDFQPLT